MIILFITFTSLWYTLFAIELSVNRQHIDFAESVDSFTNNEQTSSFCDVLNSACIDDSCNRCECKRNDVFVSYNYGCQNYTAIQQLFNGSVCFDGRKGLKVIPIIRSQTLFGHICSNLYTKRTTQNMNPYTTKCRLVATSSINILNGQQEYFNQSLLDVRYTTLYRNCIYCTNFSCPLKDLAGMFLKIYIKCQDEYNKLVNTCFMTKIDGMLQRNVTLTSFSTKSPVTVVKLNKKTNIVIIIVIITVSLCLVIIIIIAVVISQRCRRKVLRRRQSHCAHFVNDSDKQLTTQTDVAHNVEKQNLTYDTAYSLVDRKDTEREETNIYYKSTVGITNENKNVVEENMYAETNAPSNSSKETENHEYMYAGIKERKSDIGNVSDKTDSIVYATLESDRGSSLHSNALDSLRLSPTDAKFVVLPGVSGNAYNEVGDIIS